MVRFLNSGLTKKWLKNYILIISIIAILIQGFYMIFLKNYYYNWIEESITNRLIAYTSFYNKYLSDNLSMNTGLAQKIVKDFEYKDKLLIEVLDTNGSIISSSMVVNDKSKLNTIDYTNSINGELGIYIGPKKSTNEKIMAISSPIYFNTDVIGVIRYSTSLNEIDKFLIKKYIETFMVLILLLSLSFFISLIFINSIIKSLKEMSKKAKQMAKGDFDQRIMINSNDELSDLANTLNYMAEEIKESQKLKNEFISSITHDIKTPLTSIIGWTELLLMQDNIQKKDLDSELMIIQDESLRLKTLVEDLLDFSKFEIDRISLNKQNIDIALLIDECIQIFLPRIKKYNIKLKMEIEPNHIISIDKNRIKQVLINIIDNALKYSFKNSDLIIKLKSNSLELVISIEDSGIGISKDELKKIKEKFYVVDKSKGGNGLGLSISEKIIHLHNGRLEIKSTKDIGTQVFIIFKKENMK